MRQLAVVSIAVAGAALLCGGCSGGGSTSSADEATLHKQLSGPPMNAKMREHINAGVGAKKATAGGGAPGAEAPGGAPSTPPATTG